MDDAQDLDELWALAAVQAARVLDADAKVMRWTGEHWVVLAQHPSPSDDGDDVTALTPTRAGAVVGADDDALGVHRLGLVEGHARSVLVTDVDCSELRAPTRLVWTSPHQDAFRAAGDLADAYTRLVTGAVRRTHARVHLQRAVTARHRVGQAQGIVMARFELTAADAFELLIRRSQDTNIKLRVLADQIIHSQEIHCQQLEVVAGAGSGGEAVTGPEPTTADEVGGLDEQVTRTSTRSLRAADDPTDHRVITSELSDALGEAIVMGPGDAAGRAEVVCAVVDELRASLEWLNDGDTREELRSLQPAVAATHEHLRRMLRLTPTETS
jgi:hypothetical protein